MFGYITPDSPYLFKKDETLYKALYCGLCKGIGKSCGQRARSALSYDMAFVSALVHNIRGEDVKIEKRRCAAHWLKRRPQTAPDEITCALGCANTALAYFKLCDDKKDGDIRSILRVLYKKGYKRALKKNPRMVEIISAGMAAQAEVEDRKSRIIDEAAEPTAVMMRELSKLYLENFSTPATEGLFYAIGKWVYLIDALDDYDKDVKKGAYNVLYAAYKKPNIKEAKEELGQELIFIFDMLFAQMRECLSQIKFNFNHDLTDNIILRGIPVKTKSIFYGGACGNCEGAINEQEKSRTART